jgi:hypothetical protein
MSKSCIALWLIIGLLLTFTPAAAQESGPDYAIRDIKSRFSEDRRTAFVEFTVVNLSTTAIVPANASLNVIATGQQMAVGTVPPLKNNETFTVSLSFPTSQFPPGSIESFRAAVGIGEVEAAGSQNIQNNFAQISITFPNLPVQETPLATPEPITTPSSRDALTDLLARFGINRSNPTQVALAIGIASAGLLLLLLLWIILRLLLVRAPSFGNWGLPYAQTPFLDPNSPAGRRQGWQLHAQNGLLSPPTEGGVQARKLLTDLNGRYLGGWRLIAVRLMSFDNYGRISRGQVLAARGSVRRLDGLARRRDRLSHAQMRKRLRPVAGALVKALRAKLDSRTLPLPLALDLRWRGKHGEVRIIFELHQARSQNWQRLEQWEPEMLVGDKAIYEIYTFTLYGQRPGETPRAFRTRLQDDLVTILALALKPEAPPQPTPDTQTHQSPVTP